MNIRIQSLGSNKTILHLNNCSILFSYRQPVVLIDENDYIFRTTDYWSKTTSKHINAYVGQRTTINVTQSELEAMISKL